MYAFKPVLACDRIANYRVGYYYPTHRFGASFGHRRPQIGRKKFLILMLLQSTKGKWGTWTGTTVSDRVRYTWPKHGKQKDGRPEFN